MDSSIGKFERERKTMIKTECLVHESGRFALRVIDRDNCDIHFLPNGDLISECAHTGYAHKLIEHLLPLIVDLDKGHTGQMYWGPFEGDDDEATARVADAIKKAGEEYSGLRKKEREGIIKWAEGE